MVMSEAEKRAAYQEAKEILKMDEKWQQLMPGERKPNFRRAARELVRRALGHKVRRNEAPLDLHDGLMHEHKPREAALIERTLKSGLYDPEVLHSFQNGAKPSRALPEEPVYPPLPPDLPDYEVFVHDHSMTLDYPSHYEPGTGMYNSSVHAPPEHTIVPTQTPASAQLPSTYEAVH